MCMCVCILRWNKILGGEKFKGLRGQDTGRFVCILESPRIMTEAVLEERLTVSWVLRTQGVRRVAGGFADDGKKEVMSGSLTA